MTSNPTSGPPQSPRLRIFVFDSPRCCSHLFRKIFSQHPQLGHILEPYLIASVVGPEGVTHQLQCSTAAKEMVTGLVEHYGDKAKTSYDDSTSILMRNIWQLEREVLVSAGSRIGCADDQRSQDKIPWIKDHAAYCVKPEIVLESIRSELSIIEIIQRFASPTKIDASLLASLTPIFLIRHPVLVARSYWDVNVGNVNSEIQDEQFEWMISIRWVRLLFQHFVQLRHGQIPVVVDAEDLVYRTSEIARAICQHLDIDEQGVSLTWEPEAAAPDDAGHFFHARLKASSGIARIMGGPLEKDLDLDAVARDWQIKYRAEVSNALRRRVEAQIPDYAYLRRYKLLQ